MTGIINIQSAIDVITNSSTSIYTIAGQWTIDTIKNIVDSLLSIANSDLKADDLFEFELSAPSYWDDEEFISQCESYIYDNADEHFSESERLTYEKLFEDRNTKSKKENNYGWSDRSDEASIARTEYYESCNVINEFLTPFITRKVMEEVDNNYYSDRFYSRGYTVKSKTNNKDAKLAAELLSNLIDLFNIEASYDS